MDGGMFNDKKTANTPDKQEGRGTNAAVACGLVNVERRAAERGRGGEQRGIMGRCRMNVRCAVRARAERGRAACVDSQAAHRSYGDDLVLQKQTPNKQNCAFHCPVVLYRCAPTPSAPSPARSPRPSSLHLDAASR
eukprot:1157389-Rhodomonas_salina.2